jgi:hypothetical protein
LYGGDGISISASHIKQQLSHLINSPEKIADMSAKCMQLVDGRGVKKVCDIISGHF